MSSTSVRLVTSTLIASALLPFLLTSAAVSSAPFSLMSAQTTLAPSRAKISAVARPMPLAAPVIMMVSRTVAELRTLSTWPGHLVLDVHIDLDPRFSVMTVRRAS